MTNLRRYKNKVVSRIAGQFPTVANMLVASYKPQASEDIPWAPVSKSPSESIIALVTTAGVHHRHQRPFDMLDPQGDPSYRVLERDTIMAEHVITHDYFDHRNADKDLNIVLPLDRLTEMADTGVIGGVAEKHYSFMGHIVDRHIHDLTEKQAPEVAAMISGDGVDAVLLTPG